MEFHDVVLFAKYNFHKSCLIPISDELTALGINHLYSSKRHQIYDMFNEHKKRIKIFVIADEYFGLFRECSEVMITTGHSMVSKNTTFSPRNSDGDYICVPSSWQKNEFIKRKVFPKRDFWITGYPAADGIFEDLKTYIPYKNRILFAPTYNKDLSLMEDLMKAERETNLFKDLKDFEIFFKLHPVLPKKYPHQYDFCYDLIKRYKNITLQLDSHSDIRKAIIWSDIVIGDCSGALLLAIAGIKPVVAYDNPARKQSSYYDPDGPEWTLRDLFAYRISDFLGFKSVIEDILKTDYKRNSRQSVVDLLYGTSQDGNSAKRIALKINDLIKGI